MENDTTNKLLNSPPKIIPSLSTLDIARIHQSNLQNDSTLSDQYSSESLNTDKCPMLPGNNNLKRPLITKDTQLFSLDIKKQKIGDQFDGEYSEDHNDNEEEEDEESQDGIEETEAKEDENAQENPVYELKEITTIKNALPKNLEPLPPGWVHIRHKSSLFLYLHKQTRVVTWSRPYFLGPANVKFHKLPLSSIPCLFQDHINNQKSKIKELEEKKLDNDDKKNKEDLKPVVDNATGNELITAEELKTYCQRSKFEIEKVKVKMYRNWLPRGEHQKRMLKQRKIIREEKKKLDKQNKTISRLLARRLLEIKERGSTEASEVESQKYEKLAIYQEEGKKLVQKFRNGLSDDEIILAKEQIVKTQNYLDINFLNKQMTQNNISSEIQTSSTGLLGECPFTELNEPEPLKFQDKRHQDVKFLNEREEYNPEFYEKSNERLFSKNKVEKKSLSEGECSDTDSDPNDKGSDGGSEEGEIISSEDEEIVRQRQENMKKLEIEKRKIEEKLRRKKEQKMQKLSDSGIKVFS